MIYISILFFVWWAVYLSCMLFLIRNPVMGKNLLVTVITTNNNVFTRGNTSVNIIKLHLQLPSLFELLSGDSSDDFDLPDLLYSTHSSPESLETDHQEHDAATVTNTNDAATVINTNDAATVSNQNDAATITNPNDAAVVSHPNDALTVTNTIDAATVINPNDVISVTNTNDAETVTNPDDDATVSNTNDAATVTNTHQMFETNPYLDLSPVVSV